MFDETVKRRFWEKVDQSGDCWVWKGAASTNGRGRFRLGARVFTPYRLAYEWEIGPIEDGLEICHTCDNPACLRPSHLFAGTRSENMQDAKKKGRLRNGSHRRLKQLATDDIAAIKAMFDDETVTLKAISKRFGLGKNFIRDRFGWYRRGRYAANRNPAP